MKKYMEKKMKASGTSFLLLLFGLFIIPILDVRALPQPTHEFVSIPGFFDADDGANLGGITAANFQGYSISFWVKPLNASAGSLVGQGNQLSTHTGWRFFIQNGKLIFRARSFGGHMAGTTAPITVDTSWKHVVGVIKRSGSGNDRLQLYVDGILHESPGGGGAPGNALGDGEKITSGGAPLRVGYYPGSTKLGGYLTNLKIWANYELSSGDVAYLKSQGPPEVRETNVWVSGSGKVYRIPMIIHHPETSAIWVAAERRLGLWNENGNFNPAADYGYNDIVLKISGDGKGLTFDTEKVITSHLDHAMPGKPWTTVFVGPMVQDNWNRVWMLYNVVIPATDDDGDIIWAGLKTPEIEETQVWKVRLSDTGDVLLREEVEGLDGVFVGPGSGILKEFQPNDGRMIIPGHSRDSSGPSGLIVYSDDNGATWEVGGDTMDGKSGEATVVERSDGTLLLSCRRSGSDRNYGHFRNMAVSLDAGESWGAVYEDSDLVSPVCHASLSAITNGSIRYLLFVNPAVNLGNDVLPSGMSTHLFRRNLVIRMSDDGGSTWGHSRVIRTGPAGYTAMMARNQSRIGIAYEAPRGEGQPYDYVNDELDLVQSSSTAWYNNGITYVDLSLGWLEDASPGDKSIEYHDLEGVSP